MSLQFKRIFCGVLIALALFTVRARAADLLIQDFGSGLCTPNNLGGPASDGATMLSSGCATGVLSSTWDATADYWYTQLTPGTSGYNLSAYDYISFDFRGSTTALNLALRLMTGSGSTVTRILNSWSAETLPTGAAQQIKVPISDFFTVTQSTAVREIRFMTFYPATGQWMEVDNIYARKETVLKVMGVDMKSSDTIRVDFNAPVDASGAIAGNYSLSPFVAVNTATRRDNNRVVELKLASALPLNTTCTLTVTGVAGVNGAVLGAQNSGTFIGFSKAAVYMDNFNRDGQSLVDTDIPAANWPNGAKVVHVGNWIAISTATKLYGSGSFLSMDASTAKSAASIMYNSSPLALNEAYHRFYFNAPQQFFSTIANGVAQAVAGIDDYNYSRNIVFYLTKTGGVPMGFVETYDGTTWTDSPGVPITPDKWNSLELYISTPANPTYAKAWLNGNRIASLSGDFTLASYWQHFYVGLQALTAANVYQRGIYFDEVVVSSLTYVGQIEKPAEVYASATDPNTLKVYLSRAVSPNETQWQNPATYSISPPLTISSAKIEDDFRTVSLVTAQQSNAPAYTLTVGASYMDSGGSNSAAFSGLRRAAYLVDDFNRPNNSKLAADSPLGPWDGVLDDSVNNVSISTTMAFRSKASLKTNDINASNYNALLMKNVDISSYAYVRAYVYLDGNFFTAMSNNQSRAIMSMAGSNAACNGGSSAPCEAIIYVNKDGTGQQRLGLEFNDSVDAYPGDYSTYIATGVWNSIELLVPSTGTAAVGKLFLNGKLTAQVTADLNNAGYWSNLYMGLGWTNSSSFLQTAYFDEVQVSTVSYIGQVVDTSSPSATTTLSTYTANGTIGLNWLSSGDDDIWGTLYDSAYTIQYTTVTAWASGNNWSTGTAGLPGYVNTVVVSTSGVDPGTPQYYPVPSLSYGNTYYFRVWTNDEYANYSPLSNGATGYLAYPANYLTVKASGGAAYTTIQAAVDAIPASMTTDYYVLVQDTWTYAESVSVKNKVTNGYRISISSDGPLTAMPLVSINTTGFDVRNASVTITGFRINNTGGSYGVYSSSGMFTVQGTSITGNSQGIYCVAPDGAVVIASNTINSVVTGIYVSSAPGGTSAYSVFITSNVILPSAQTVSRTAVALNYLANGATVQYNTVQFPPQASGVWQYSLDLKESPRSVIKNNIFNLGGTTGSNYHMQIRLLGSSNCLIKYNSISGIINGRVYGISLNSSTHYSSGTVITNNIIFSSGTDSGNPSLGLYLADGNQWVGLVSDYNDIYSPGTANLVGGSYDALASWQAATGQDKDSIEADPLWTATAWANPDFHVRSPAGRYSGGAWVTADVSTSPVIDSGDPTENYALEPAPNGGRVNLGRYGGTSEASKTPVYGNNVWIDETGEQFQNLSQALVSLSTSAINGNRTVEVSTGIYNESATSTAPINTNGYTLIIRRDPGATAPVGFDGQSARTVGLDLKLTATSTATITNLSFLNYANYGVRVNSGNVVKIDSVAVTGTGISNDFSGFYGFNITSQFTVTRSSASNFMYGCRADTITGSRLEISSSSFSQVDTGLSVSAVSAASVLITANNVQSASGSYGAFLSTITAASGLEVSSSTFANSIYGLSMTSVTAPGTLVSFNIVRPMASGTGRAAIYMNALSNGATVQYNEVYFSGTTNVLSHYGLQLQYASRSVIKNNIFSQTSAGSNYVRFIYLGNSTYCQVKFNDIIGLTAGYVWGVNMISSSGTVITNNIIFSSGTSGTNSYGLYFDGTSQPGTVSDYNDIYSPGTGNLAVYWPGTYDTLASWQAAIGQDMNSIEADPLWVSTASAAPDFHERSPAGRYSGGSWVTTDVSTSPAIDSGNPADDYSQEPGPNGGRVNLGRYGATDQASKSPVYGKVWIDETSERFQNLSQALASLSTSTINGNRTVEVSTGAYNEGVTSTAPINTNGYTLTIRKDPGATSPVYFDGQGIRTVGLDLKLANTSTVTVSNLSFLNYANYGVRVTGGGVVTVDSVTVTGPGVANNYTGVYGTGITGGFTVSRSSATNFFYGYRAGNITGALLQISSCAAAQVDTGIHISTISAGRVLLSGNIVNSASGGYGGYLYNVTAPSGLEVSSSTFLSSLYGLSVASATAGGVLVSSNTIVPMTATVTRSAIILDTLSNGATVQYNGVYFQGSQNVGTHYGLYLNAVRGAMIRNNVISQTYSGTNYLHNIYLNGSIYPTIKFNSVMFNSSGYGYGVQLAASSGAVITNNIIYMNGTGNSYALYFDAVSLAGMLTNYNDIYAPGAINAAGYVPTTTYDTLASWQGTGRDLNSIEADPLWVSAAVASPDFHERSPAGRYSAGSWVTTDVSTSPAIDKGDPAEDWSQEPVSNGGIVNVGRYGNTSQASKSVINPPGLVMPAFNPVYSSSLTMTWASGSAATGFNPAWANYVAQVSTASNFTGTVTSTQTANLYGTPQNLFPNTTYYGRADAFINSSTSIYTNFGSTVTLANPVLNPQIYAVFTTSVTLNWAPHPAAPSSSTCEGYLVQASTASDFSAPVFSTATYNVALSTLVAGGLNGCTTYYFRVGSYNWTYTRNYSYLGSVKTSTYLDCGLRYYDGFQVVVLACQPVSCDPGIRLRTMAKDGLYGITLVDIADPNASKIRILTPEGVKAIRKY